MVAGGAAGGAAVAQSAAGVPGGGGEKARPASPPSVLVVTLDTTRADHLGAYGRKPSITPHLDRLAAEGVRFARAVSPSPLTLPAHATMWTSLPPRLHGVRDNAPFVLGDEHETLAEALGARGHRTAAVVAAAVLDRATGIGQGFARYDDNVRVGPREWFDWRERGASQVADAAIEILTTLEPPFFLWVHFYDPHLPYVPPDAFRERAGGDAYAGEIAFMDDRLGAVWARARERAGAGGLVVAALADHGESLGEHGEKDHGVFIYQATQHVPLIVAGPGVPRGVVVEETVGIVDLAPTLLALAAAPPLARGQGRDLAVLWGSEKAGAGGAAGETSREKARVTVRGPVREPVRYEMESLHPAFAYGWSPLIGIVEGPHKLVSGPQTELFDLDRDPRERENRRAADTARARVLATDLDARFETDETLERARTGGPPVDGAQGAGEVRGAEVDAAAAERLARLRSLGYASSAGGATRAEEPRPDPKVAILWLRDLDEARLALNTWTDRRAAGARAIALLAPILAKNPGNQPVRLTLGSAHLAKGDARAAVVVFKEAVERAPGDYLTWFHLGRGLAAFGPSKPAELDEAEAAYARAIALYPRYADAAYALADLRVARGDVPGARTALREAESRGVEDPALLTLRGEVEAALGAMPAADAAFARAIALDARHAPAWEGRGKLAFLRGDVRAAIDYYERALDAAPAANLARTLGSLHLELGDIPRARAAFTRALSLEPTGPAAADIRSLLSTLE